MPRNPNSPYNSGCDFPAIPHIAPTANTLTNANENLKLQAMLAKLESSLSKATYQIWLDNGHEGTEEDFLNWLVGPPTTIIVDGRTYQYITETKAIDLSEAFVPYSSALSHEVERATAEDIRLANLIANATRSIREECDLLYASIDAEASSRISADSKLTVNLKNETTRAIQRENDLEQSLNTAVVNLTAADNQERQERQIAVGEIYQRIEALQTRVNGLATAIQLDLELARADFNEGLSIERSEREQADLEIRGELSTETDRARDAEDLLTKNLAREILDRTTGDSALNNLILTESAERTNAMQLEEAARTAADATLTANLNATATELTNAIEAEKAAREDADIFYTDILTVNSLGGIKANADLNGMSVREVLTTLLYPYVQFVLGSPSRSAAAATLENGATQTLSSASISITKKSKAITSVKLLNGSTVLGEKTGDEVAAGGTITFSNLGITVSKSNNPNLKFTVTDGATSADKSIGASTFVYPYYWGKCAKDATIDEALVESLTKKIESKGNKTDISFTCADERMVFAYPKAHGVLKSIIDPNNFEIINDFTKYEVSITGLDETTQTYYVYVSGASTVTAFKVDFKY
jgi:hypothetical protein